MFGFRNADIVYYTHAHASSVLLFSLEPLTMIGTAVWRTDTKVLHAFLWLYEVWEGVFLGERFMDTELEFLDLPCNVDDFCKIQVKRF